MKHLKLLNDRKVERKKTNTAYDCGSCDNCDECNTSSDYCGTHDCTCQWCNYPG